MKTKLTLTLEKSTIEKARRYAKASGRSISRIVEEIFEQTDPDQNKIMTSQQRAVKRLMQKLQESPSMEERDDKALIIDHVAKKYS